MSEVEQADAPIVDPVTEAVPQETEQVEESLEGESTEEATASDGDNSTAEQPKKAKGVQKRIDELTRLRHDAERDRDYWRQVAMQEKQPEQPKPEPQQPIMGEPRLEQFEDYDDYIIAKAKHELKVEQDKAQEAQQTAQREQQRAEQTRQFQSEIEKARQKYTDFDSVAFNPAVPYSDTMTDLVLQSDQGSDIAYYLGQNPNEAYRIANLDPVNTARELGKLEVKLTLPQPKTVTNAPPPAAEVGTRETVTKDPAKMSTEEWMAWRNNQLNR